MLESLFSVVHASERATNEATTNLLGRNVFLQRGVVTNNKDPENQRRLKVSTASKGGSIESNWLWRLNTAPFTDEALPDVGQTVIVGFFDGNPHDGVWLGVLTNEPNPSRPSKVDVIKDRWVDVPGNDDLTAEENITVVGGKTVKLMNRIGAYIELNEAGFVVIGDAFGHRWTLGGSGGSSWVWDANGATIEIINAQDMTIEDKSIATIGAIDDEGDVLVTRGW